MHRLMARIVDADVNASAAIAGTKISAELWQSDHYHHRHLSPALGTAAAQHCLSPVDTNGGS
jgi:hypothetical protein